MHQLKHLWVCRESAIQKNKTYSACSASSSLPSPSKSYCFDTAERVLWVILGESLRSGPAMVVSTFGCLTPVQITIFLAGLDSLSRVQTLASRTFTDGVEWNDTRRRHLFYASFLKPLYELCDDSLLNGTSKRDRKQTAFHRLLAEGLRLSKSDAKSMEALLRSSTDLRDLVGDLDVMNSNLSNQEKSDLRWRFWKALRPLGRLRKESIVFSPSLHCQCRCHQLQSRNIFV